MTRRLALLLMLLIIPALLGCPGNTRLDKEAQGKLWEWILEQDEAGWAIMGYPGTELIYKDMILDHRFRPTRLDIAINGEEMNPYHQRNWIEQIVREWRNKYPANLRPRFNLKVYLYNGEINNDNELGFTEIDTNGTVDTHHGKTHDVM